MDQAAAPRIRLDFAASGWKADDLAVVRSALHDNVRSPGGTAGRANSPRTAIAGITGTLQFIEGGQRTNHAWFIGYAPADLPRYAIAVLVQNAASGSKVAAPVARLILESLAGDLPPATPLTPAIGHLNRLEEVK